MDLLPKVFRTEGNITEFDPSKIFESILKETSMNEIDAKHITELVVRRIISSGIKFLSGPHIREIVCSILSEQHFEKERKLYTRIGMPLMDYEELLERVSNGKFNKWVNPERINHWSSNQIAEEYAHLRILNNEQSKAHLSGDIHINGLCFFDLRPFTQIWDPRLILNYGFPPINNLSIPLKQNPPNNLSSALSQYFKWLGTVQSEFYGLQSLNLITLFLAPFVTNLTEGKIKKEIRKLIYEINLLPIIVGCEISSTAILSSVSIPEIFSRLPAINPNRKFVKAYSDYNKDCLKLFKSLVFVLKEIKKQDNNFPTTRFQILLTNTFFDVIHQKYPRFWDDIKNFENISTINFSFDAINNIKLEKMARTSLYNFGVLQNISLNLPRYAYISQDEGKFLELLGSKVSLSSEILLKKIEIIEKRLKLKHLPFCSSKVNKDSLFKLENQDLSLSLVGLNESIKYLTNYELHEHSDAIKFGEEILKELNRICVDLTEIHGRSFIISENESKKAVQRFTKLDAKHFPRELKSQYTNLDYKYTNSTHFRNDIEIDLFKRVEVQGEFHHYLKNGAVEYISLSELDENDVNLQEFIKILSKKSRISSINFSS